MADESRWECFKKLGLGRDSLTKESKYQDFCETDRSFHHTGELLAH